MYLYIFEDGKMAIFEAEPNDIDLDSCEEGALEIVNMEDGCRYKGGGEWEEIERPEIS